ncbi:peptide chain release factor N(5)-glutamine methyltransferase [Massilibacteroides sp.]|uniref:peptide chain release factor N(5)-glutamine methyltransferase n=1 Tax=Massilibacteroides sp. TaxID=2034766 RepID=UPI00260813F4|nr:peptide chain release factor N(5)-glutamine methyltransferase [Massilibacteroides sp.]MDD4514864.1 peptide chain release factor N(5)-glutamine methyltransferase [Massilibacteroides sp.]
MNDTIAYLRKTLENQFPPEEIRSLTHLIMKEVCHLEPHQLILDKDRDLSEAMKGQIKSIVERLLRKEPIQYILGTTVFYGNEFFITPSVLIPRPETEELVDLIVRTEKTEKLNVLDIGTGSGCIAISLANALDHAKVTGIDISEEALSLARSNATRNKAKVSFLSFDVLTEKMYPDHKLDIIVSNPPYVMEKEKEEMKPNVLEYEPHLALFVSNHDPLVFYRAIAEFGLLHLNNSGRIYFEINEALGNETVELLIQKGYRDCILVKDLAGKDRIIKALR